MGNQRYLGDGVYAEFDGHYVWLYTQEGMRIAIEPSVYDSLTNYIQEIIIGRKED